MIFFSTYYFPLTFNILVFKKMPIIEKEYSCVATFEAI